MKEIIDMNEIKVEETQHKYDNVVVEETKNTENKSENKSEKKEDKKEVHEKLSIVDKSKKILDNEDLFVTEKSTFEVNVRYYKDENGQYIVEGVDENFEENNDQMKSFSVKLKYPSQADYQAILSSPSFKNIDQLKAVDVVMLELNRFSILVRGWSLQQDLSRLLEMDPRLIKGILWSVNQKIGMLGIW